MPNVAFTPFFATISTTNIDYAETEFMLTVPFNIRSSNAYTIEQQQQEECTKEQSALATAFAAASS